MTYWPGTKTPRSTGNAFTGAVPGAQLSWDALNLSAKLRRTSSAAVEKQRAEGFDPGAVLGISRKADSLVLRGKKLRQLAVGKKGAA
jgi:hypothetical protein